MILQAKLVAKGEDLLDPTEMDGGELFGLFLKSVTLGGGLGLIGDTVTAALDADGYNNSVIKNLAGPLAGDVEKLFKDIILRNIGQEAIGKESKFLLESAKFTKGLIPGQNMWWSKQITDAAIEEVIYENLK